MPRINQTLDGFKLIRPLGLGALGQVWLCREEETGQLKALRTLLPQDASEMERMEATLQWYRTTAAGMKGLIPVEAIGRTPEGEVYFTMPLADGVEGHAPEDEHWKPLTLSRQIHFQILLKEWFNTAQMKRLLVPVLEGVKRLYDAGMPHHEINPDDILFVAGRPMLADFSFLSHEPPLASVLLSASPEKAAFLSSEGTSTLWNVATHLFTVLTGQPGEKLSRSTPLQIPADCRFPSKEDQAEWQRLQKVLHQILWAAPAKRMTHLREIIDAINEPQTRPLRIPKRAIATAGAVACGTMAAVFVPWGSLKPLFAGENKPVLPPASEITRLIAERDEAIQQRFAAEQEVARLRAELEALKQPKVPRPKPTPDPEIVATHAELEAAIQATIRQLYGVNKKAPAPKPLGAPSPDLGKALQESLNEARVEAVQKLQNLDAPSPDAVEAEKQRILNERHTRTPQ